MSIAEPTSLWFDALRAEGIDTLVPRPALTKNARFDVCIVGAGLTGLWTAYYLAKADPALSIAVLEKEIAGYGASGRNGGWCSALFPSSAASLARTHGHDAAVAMRQEMVNTVDEVRRVVTAEQIECDFATGGTITFARSAPQLESARAPEWERMRRTGNDK